MRPEMSQGSEAAFSSWTAGENCHSKKGGGHLQRPPGESHSLFRSVGSQSETWEGFVQRDLNHILCRANSKIIPAHLVLVNWTLLSLEGFYLSCCEVLSVFSGGSVSFVANRKLRQKWILLLSQLRHHHYHICFRVQNLSQLSGQWIPVSRNSDDTLPRSNHY